VTLAPRVLGVDFQRGPVVDFQLALVAVSQQVLGADIQRGPGEVSQQVLAEDSIQGPEAVSQQDLVEAFQPAPVAVFRLVQAIIGVVCLWVLITKIS
jgi:hypothetical protein